MESEAEKPPRARHRFGFSGRRKRATLTNSRKSSVSTDEILDSLTRQASTQIGLGDEQTQRLELLDVKDEPTLYSEPPVHSIAQFRSGTSRSLGRYVIILMCATGMLIVWLANSSRSMLNLTVLSSVIQKTGVQAVFANPAEIGIVSMIAFVTALWVALRRRASRSQLSI